MRDSFFGMLSATGADGLHALLNKTPTPSVAQFQRGIQGRGQIVPNNPTSDSFGSGIPLRPLFSSSSHICSFCLIRGQNRHSRFRFRNTPRSSPAACASAMFTPRSCPFGSRPKRPHGGERQKASSSPAVRPASTPRAPQGGQGHLSISASRPRHLLRHAAPRSSTSAARSSAPIAANTAPATEGRVAVPISSGSCPATLDVWNSHGDKITKLPKGFRALGTHRKLPARRHRRHQARHLRPPVSPRGGPLPHAARKC